MNDVKGAFKIPAAAIYADCSASTIRAAIRSGHLTPRYLEPSTTRVIPKAELDRWINESPADKPT